MKKPNKSGRTRVFACVVYPESAPEDWIKKIRDSCIPCFISPLHDQDVNESDGEIKKPHHHVLTMYDGVKTPEQYEEFRNSFGGVGMEFVQSVRGYARYLCHLDNPEKHRYNIDDVIQTGGADYQSLISTNGDKRKVVREMVTFVRSNNIIHFTELMDYAMDNEPEWYDALTNNCSYVLNTYIQDNRIQNLMRSRYT